MVRGANAGVQLAKPEISGAPGRHVMCEVKNG